MISDAIRTAFLKKEERGWDEWPQLYVFIDLHDVIIQGTYTRNNEGKAFYPHAKEVLQNMTKNPKFSLILWTSSHADAIRQVVKWLDENDIYFDYSNENPEVKSNGLLNVESKPYFDILFDDKAGFVGEKDWEVVKNTLIELGEWL